MTACDLSCTTLAASCGKDLSMRGSRVRKTLTSEQRRERDRRRWASRTPEQRENYLENDRERARKRWASMTPEQRQERAREWWANTTPEQRERYSANRRKARKAMTELTLT
jgi:hypothetical protein